MESKGNRRKVLRKTNQNRPNNATESSVNTNILADLRRSLQHVQTSIDTFYNEESTHRSNSYDPKSEFRLQPSHCINDDYDREIANLNTIHGENVAVGSHPSDCFEKLHECVRRQYNSLSPNFRRKVALSDRYLPAKEEVPLNNCPPQRKVCQIGSIGTKKSEDKVEKPSQSKITPYSWRKGEKLIHKPEKKQFIAQNPKNPDFTLQPDVPHQNDCPKDSAERLSRWSIDERKPADSSKSRRLDTRGQKITPRPARNYPVKEVVEYMEKKRAARQRNLKNQKLSEINTKATIKQRLNDLYHVQSVNARRKVPPARVQGANKDKITRKQEAFYRAASKFDQNCDSESTSSGSSESTIRATASPPKDLLFDDSQISNDKMTMLIRQAGLIRQRIAKASKEIKPLLIPKSEKSLKTDDKISSSLTTKATLPKNSNVTPEKVRQSKGTFNKYANHDIDVRGNRRRPDGNLPPPGALRDNYNIIDIISSRLRQIKLNERPGTSHYRQTTLNGDPLGQHDYSPVEKKHYEKELPEANEETNLSREFERKIDFDHLSGISSRQSTDIELARMENPQTSSKDVSSTGDTETRESIVESLRYSPTSLAAKFSLELTHLDSIDKSLSQLTVLGTEKTHPATPAGDQPTNTVAKPRDPQETIETAIMAFDESQQSYYLLLIEWLQKNALSGDLSPNENISLISELQSRMTAEKTSLNELDVMLLGKRMELVNRKYYYSHLMATFNHFICSEDQSKALDHIKLALTEINRNDLGCLRRIGVKTEDKGIETDFGAIGSISHESPSIISPNQDSIGLHSEGFREKTENKILEVKTLEVEETADVCEKDNERSEDSQILHFDFAPKIAEIEEVEEREESSFYQDSEIEEISSEKRGDSDDKSSLAKSEDQNFNFLQQRVCDSGKVFEVEERCDELKDVVEEIKQYGPDWEPKEEIVSEKNIGFNEDSYSEKFFSESDEELPGTAKRGENDFEGGGEQKIEGSEPMTCNFEAMGIDINELSSEISEEILSVKSCRSLSSLEGKESVSENDEKKGRHHVDESAREMEAIPSDVCRVEQNLTELPKDVIISSVDDIDIALSEDVEDVTAVQKSEFRVEVETEVKELMKPIDVDFVKSRSIIFAHHFWPLLVSMKRDDLPNYEISPLVIWETDAEHLVDDIIMSIVYEYAESIRARREASWSWLPRRRVFQERSRSKECIFPGKIEDFKKLIESGVSDILFGDNIIPNLKISRQVDDIEKLLLSQLAKESRMWRDYEETDAHVKEGLVGQITTYLVKDTIKLLKRLFNL